MEGNITLSQKEIRRGQILEQVMIKQLTLKEVCRFLGVGYRQAKRLKARYVHDSTSGLAHGNRGMPSPRALDLKRRQHIIDLRQDRYSQFNDVHFTEMLQAREDIHISRVSVRHILRAAGIPPKRSRRPPKHRSRRPPKIKFGMMAQCDGSPHLWFGPDHPPCCLMLAVDDATSTILAAFFVPTETAEAYLRLLDMVLQRYGIPLALYHDRHASLVRNDGHWSLEEQLQGFQYPTHVGRVLEDLGIQSIPAYSAQAKGRVERSFGVLQDRLIAELALEGITDMDSANSWLTQTFIPRYNRRFSKKPATDGSAFRKISSQERFYKLAFAYEAVVGNDNCVRLGGITFDIPSAKIRFSFAKKTVQVRQHLDGSWSLWFKQQKIAVHPPTPFREPIRSWRPKSKDQTGAKQITQVYISSKPAPLLPRTHWQPAQEAGT